MIGRFPELKHRTSFFEYEIPIFHKRSQILQQQADYSKKKDFSKKAANFLKMQAIFRKCTEFP